MLKVHLKPRSCFWVSTLRLCSTTMVAPSKAASTRVGYNKSDIFKYNIIVDTKKAAADDNGGGGGGDGKWSR